MFKEKKTVIQNMLSGVEVGCNTQPTFNLLPLQVLGIDKGSLDAVGIS
jgi:hypothetical protein